jgi:hypothetical protein
LSREKKNETEEEEEINEVCAWSAPCRAVRDMRCDAQEMAVARSALLKQENESLKLFKQLREHFASKAPTPDKV